MQSRDFCFWLQGFFEISNTTNVSHDQMVLIKKHLDLVFKHEIDPSMGDAQHQEKLNKIHNPLSEYEKDQLKFTQVNKDVLLRC